MEKMNFAQHLITRDELQKSGYDIHKFIVACEISSLVVDKENAQFETICSCAYDYFLKSDRVEINEIARCIRDIIRTDILSLDTLTYKDLYKELERRVCYYS